MSEEKICEKHKDAEYVLKMCPDCWWEERKHLQSTIEHQRKTIEDATLASLGFIAEIEQQDKEIEGLRKNNNIYWQALYYISDNDLYPDGCRKWAKQALTPTEPMITEGARIDERNKHERSSKIL